MIHPGSLLPVKNPRTQVLCPSVFTPTGWVSRPLVISELARAFDQPESLAKAFGDKSVQQIPLASLPFLLACPSKLLEAYLSHHGPAGLTVWHHEINLQSEGICSLSESESSSSTFSRTPLPSVHLPVDQSPARMPVDQGYFGRVKAAKNDDAEIPVSYWDELVWAFWRSDALVGSQAASFIEQFHCSPLTSLRKLALRYERISLFRSFSRFMRRQYGDHSWFESPEDTSTRSEWFKTMAAARDCLTRANQVDWWDWHGRSRLFFWRWPSESRG